MRSRPGVRLHEFPDAESMYGEAALALSRLAKQAITSRRSFHVVLAGGSTPLPLYRRLGKLATDWNAWHVYFGDERCLPRDHPERNSVLIDAAWLHKSPIPKQQIYVIPGELGMKAAARDYAKSLQGVQFDLVLLGLGEDGHTASLFPGQDLGEGLDAAAVLPVYDAPKPPPERVSLSARRLSEARRVFFLVAGDEKRHALEQLMDGAKIPAAAIRPMTGVDIYTDINL